MKCVCSNVCVNGPRTWQITISMVKMCSRIDRLIDWLIDMLFCLRRKMYEALKPTQYTNKYISTIYSGSVGIWMSVTIKTDTNTKRRRRTDQANGSIYSVKYLFWWIERFSFHSVSSLPIHFATFVFLSLFILFFAHTKLSLRKCYVFIRYYWTNA